jgi:hypothetical protein
LNGFWTGPDAVVQQEKTPIAFLGLPALDEAVLTMVIERFLGAELVIAPPDEAHTALIDGDSNRQPGLVSEWRRRNPQAPAIVLSLSPGEDSTSTIHVRRPINIEILIAALRRLHSDLQTRRQPSLRLVPAAGPDPEDVPSVRSGQDGKPPSAVTANRRASSSTPGPGATRPAGAIAAPLPIQPVALLSDDQVEAEGRDYCGMATDLPLADPRRRGAPLPPDIALQLYFDPDMRLLGLLRRAARLAADSGDAVLIRSPHGSLQVLGSSPPRVFSTIEVAALRPLCSSSLFSETLEVAPIQPQPQDGSFFEYSPLLWKIALWSSRGRLPRGTDPYSVVRVLRSPDWQLLVKTPYADAIWALWVSEPVSIVDTAARLHLPQRYVFALYSAAQLLGLVAALASKSN